MQAQPNVFSAADRRTGGPCARARPSRIAAVQLGVVCCLLLGVAPALALDDKDFCVSAQQLAIAAEKDVGVWIDRYGPGERDRTTLNLYWQARVVGGELRAADDVSDLGWFPLDGLPGPDELAFTTVVDVLAAVRDEHT